jgi:hypothetical protein
MARKPEGLDKFHKLLSGLAKVPKRQLDAEVEKWQHKKRAKKRKK